MPPSSLLLLTEADVGALPLDTEIGHVVGSSAVTLTRPANARFLVLQADQGGFRLRPGANQSLPATEMPAASVADGTGAIYVAAGQKVIIPGFSAAAVTVKGYSATAVLTYYWC